MSRIHEKGFSRLIFRKLNSGLTDYEGTAIHVTGAMEYSGTLSRSRASISADDDPTYISAKGPYQGDLTVKITGAPVADVAAITEVIKAANNVLAYGEDGADVYVGMKFTRERIVDGVVGYSDQMYHKCIVEPPEVTGKSKDENGSEIADISLVVHVYPLLYTAGGVTKMRTMSQINSFDSSALYENVKDTIVLPSTMDGTATGGILKANGTLAALPYLSITKNSETKQYYPAYSKVGTAYTIEPLTAVVEGTGVTAVSLAGLHTGDTVKYTINGVTTTVTASSSSIALNTGAVASIEITPAA